MPSPVPGQEDFSQQGRTFQFELARAVPSGFVDTAAGTFAIFIAIRVFDLSPVLKGTMLAAGSFGLILSLFVVQIARRLGRPVNQLAALIWILAAHGFAVAALSEGHGERFFAGCCIAFTAVGMGTPLISQIYRKHYPDESRGRLFSFTAMIRAGAAGLVGWGAGAWISSRGEAFSPLFWSYSAACLVMAACVTGIAPVVLRRSNQLKWFDAFRHVGNDKPFRKLLVIWMIFGFGNLIAWALFVEFISNPTYGFGLDAEQVALISTTVPMLVFITCVVPWGMVFDRLPFYSVRAMVNFVFIAGILIFFLGGNLISLVIGIGLHGLARSGGNILWTLWVTRFADSDRVLEYMSVHTFLTGARGVMAPLVAFAAAEYLSPTWVAWASAGMIFVSTLAIFPELMAELRERRSKAS